MNGAECCVLRAHGRSGCFCAPVHAGRLLARSTQHAALRTRRPYLLPASFSTSLSTPAAVTAAPAPAPVITSGLAR